MKKKKKWIRSEWNVPEEKADLSLSFKHQNSSGCQAQAVLVAISSLQVRSDEKTGREKKEDIKELTLWSYHMLMLRCTFLSLPVFHQGHFLFGILRVLDVCVNGTERPCHLPSPYACPPRTFRATWLYSGSWSQPGLVSDLWKRWGGNTCIRLHSPPSLPPLHVLSLCLLIPQTSCGLIWLLGISLIVGSLPSVVI